MLKWILGGIAVFVGIVACVIWFGYQKLQEFANIPPVSTVTIAAPASRVFATLASGDSMSTWMPEGRVISPHEGLLNPGDTIQITGPANDSRRSGPWVVTASVPNKLFAVELFSPGARPLYIERRDSLIAIGDSTRVVSTYASSLMDSVTRNEATRSPTASRIGGIAVKAMLSAMRMQGDIQLGRIKDRIEGRVEAAGTARKPSPSR